MIIPGAIFFFAKTLLPFSFSYLTCASSFSHIHETAFRVNSHFYHLTFFELLINSFQRRVAEVKHEWSEFATIKDFWNE